MTESKRIFPWPEGEIVASYQSALDKKAQIKILADLNVCSKQEIEDLLRSHGVELPEVKPVPRAVKWTVQEEDRLRKLAGEGKTTKEIAELMGRTYKAVEQKLSKMHISLRQQQVETETPEPKTIEPDRSPIVLPYRFVEGRHVDKSTGLTYDELLAILFDTMYTTDLNASVQTLFARLGVKLLEYLMKGNTYDK